MNKIINEEDLLSDIHNIRLALGSRCRQIAIFGSALKEGPEKARDIDLAIFMDRPSTEYVAKCLNDLKLNYSFNKDNISFCYGGGGGFKLSDGAKVIGFDLVVLDSDKPDVNFMNINHSSLRFMH